MARCRSAVSLISKISFLDIALPLLAGGFYVCAPRTALFSPATLLPVENCVGRVLAAANVGCPPAVPIVACGERIDENALRCFRYYGIQTCSVMKERP